VQEKARSEFERIRSIAERKGVKVKGTPSTEDVQAMLTPLGSRMVGGDPEKLKAVAHRFEDSPPFYAHGSNSIFMGKSRSPAVLSHELGHATGRNTLLRVAPYAQLAGSGVMAAGVLRGLAGAASGSPSGIRAGARSLRNHLLLGTAIGAGPTLVEEGRATARALLAARRRGKAREYAKELLPLQATYPAYLLAPGLLAAAATAEVARRVV